MKENGNIDHHFSNYTMFLGTEMAEQGELFFLNKLNEIRTIHLFNFGVIVYGSSLFEGQKSSFFSK